MSEVKLDAQRVGRLAEQILLLVKANFVQGPFPSQERVYEALNALAIAAGAVIAGTNDPAALEFFNHGLFKQMDSLLEHAKEPD